MDMNIECNGGDGFIDRSKVRILVCDNDSKSLKEVFTLLSECSYQVTSVKSARHVIDALNVEGPDIDIILAEVDLPMAKGMKMLSYITRDKDLRRIPVIMMSRQDEVSVVVKCLKLGAADYLVKPLRTNELLNLWTHMWRRRRMLGLVEKNMLNYDFDVAESDLSDANTNSTNLSSDHTNDKSLRCTNLQTGTSNYQENEGSVAAVSASIHTSDDGNVADSASTNAPAAVDDIDPSANDLAGLHLPESTKRDSDTGTFSSGPKKNKLKIGESSAFFTYVKSTVPRTNCQDPPRDNEIGSLRLGLEEKLQVATEENHHNISQACESRETLENYLQGDDLQSGTSFPNSLEPPCSPPTTMEFHNMSYQEGNIHRGIYSFQAGGSLFSAQHVYPYYIPGMINQVMMQSAAHVHASSTMIPQYGHHFPHCPPSHPNVMVGFPYYQSKNTSVYHGQMSLQNGHQSWSQAGNPPSNELKMSKVDRREEALLKFRRKRNQRCFDKKIRYVNRKRLAERRPRVKGQFVGKVNGMNVDLNGQLDSADYDDEEEEEDEEQDSSPLEF